MSLPLRRKLLPHYKLIPASQRATTVFGVLAAWVIYDSVVQRLLTYGPFYKNVTTRGPLPTKCCIKHQIHKTYTKMKSENRWVKWACQWSHLHNSNKQFITNLYQCFPLIKDSLTLLFQYQYVSGSKSENMVRWFAFHSISFCLFDLLHGRKCTLIHAWASKRRANFKCEIFRFGKPIFAD